MTFYQGLHRLTLTDQDRQYNDRALVTTLKPVGTPLNCNKPPKFSQHHRSKLNSDRATVHDV
jgi:hypothetical protein